MNSNSETPKNENNPEKSGLSLEEQQFIATLQAEIHYPKGSIILYEGQLTSKSFHIIKGCIRKYHLKDGEEKTTDFFIENDAITTRSGATKQIKSTYNLECLEDCILTVMTAEQEDIIYEKFPRFQSMCRINTEEQLAEYQEMFSKFVSSSPEERYLNLQETRPDLLNRVPQYQLASYLGVKPESLSRIRKRLMG